MKSIRTMAEHIAIETKRYALAAMDAAKAHEPTATKSALQMMACDALGISLATFYRLMARTPALSRRKGKIYLMKHEGAGAFKIGFTAGNPHYREETLQADDPRVVLVQWWVGTLGEERELHILFADKRRRGEWFDLTPEDLVKMRQWMRSRSRAPAIS